MQRLIIVYNPRSSKHAKIQAEVIKPLQEMSGYQIGKFAIQKAPVDDNVRNLMKVLLDGDLIVVAGGDGTATVALNAAMRVDAKVTLGVLGYGNFNDMARMLGENDCTQLISDYENHSVQKLYPLSAEIDGELYRYAACYFTIGMFAESTEEFDAQETRKDLKRGKKGICYSIRKLAAWYFRNKQRDFLPSDIQMNDQPLNHLKITKSGRKNIAHGKCVSDVLFVNSQTVAKIMKGKNYWRQNDCYLVSSGKLKNFWRLIGFMIKSLLFRIPGTELSELTKIDFSGPVTIEIQAEGEYQRKELTELVVKKAQKSISVIVAEKN